MFELPRFTGTPKEGIVVQTARGESLANYISPPPPGNAGMLFAAMCKKHPGWEVRCGERGRYNCAGLVWANRRTCLTSPNDWQMILSDGKGDDYDYVGSRRDARIGDVVCYREKETKEILHVGRICKIESLLSGSGVPLTGSEPIIHVLSKLDNKLGEVVHRIDDIGELCGTAEYTAEIWTDRA